MPLQFVVSADARRRTERYTGVGKAQTVAMNPAGRVIGQLNQVESRRSVIYRLLSEYADRLEYLNYLTPDHQLPAVIQLSCGDIRRQSVNLT